MLNAIRAIKQHGAHREAREALLAASDELAARGAKVQFIACSEFSIIADSIAPAARGIDTIDLLVQAIIAASLNGISGAQSNPN